MTVKQIKQLLKDCTSAQRRQIFRFLRTEFAIHPLELQLHTKAEIILEAISRAGEITLRMMRGVIAEAAFEVEVVDRLKGWAKTPRLGNVAYDFLLSDQEGEVRVQVKLQRSKAGRPMRARQAARLFSEGMYVVETQKTRGGTTRKTGSPTRPYRFGEFDLLAVAMYPSTSRWDTFMYTVGTWLLPSPSDRSVILKFQPVPMMPNDDWTDDFHTAVGWLRSGKEKTVRSQ